MSDFLIMAGGLMSAFVVGYSTAYAMKMVRRFLDQI